ncbi:MAG: hypothetical protein J6I53_12325 [Treponema sp.]|nr:hypothetical protein [Treponema sp.]
MKNKNFSKKFLLGILIAIVIFLVVGRNGNKSNEKNYTVEQTLSYLNEIEEVKWVKIEKNNAYIGFNPCPDDWLLIIKAAALRANKATDFGFHVWAVDASKYEDDWRPGNGKAIGETTARHGKIEK